MTYQEGTVQLITNHCNIMKLESKHAK